MKKSIIFILLVALNLFSDDKSLAKGSGSNLGQAAISKYGSKSKVNSNLAAPLQSGGQISTLDGSKTFGVSMNSCAENNEGIKLIFQPQSGGVLNVQVNQDTNATGSYNYSTSFTGIDNICSGGFKANTGKFYKYTFDVNTMKVSLVQVTRSDIGGCFCITSACNFAGYSQNLADKITGDIIGIIGASGIANYQVGINRYDSASKTYYLYVKNNKTCNAQNLGNNYTNINPTAYYSSQSIPPISVGDVAAKDGNKTDSLYYITSNVSTDTINSTSGGANHNITTKNINNCTVKKVPYLDSSGEIKIETKSSCVNVGSCVLDREEICDNSGRECINKILNRTATSLTIPVKCQAFNDEYQVCANGNNFTKVSNKGAGSSVIESSSRESYFYSNRYYDCGSQTFSHNASKTNNTLDSVSKSGSVINYQDFNGGSQNINLGDFNNCEVRWCSYKKVENSTQVYTDGTSNVSTKDGTSTNELLYKQCSKLSTGSYTCPLESGEVLKESCSCNIGMTGASMAIGYAAAVEDAVKDFTCSSN